MYYRGVDRGGRRRDFARALVFLYDFVPTGSRVLANPNLQGNMDVEEGEIVDGVFLFFGCSLIAVGVYLVYLLVTFCFSSTKSQVYPTVRETFHETLDGSLEEMIQEHHLERWTDVSPSVRNMVRRRVRPTFLDLPRE